MTAAGATRDRAAVQHFHHLDEEDRQRLFLHNPAELDANTDREVLATALGATLYMPADRDDLTAVVQRRAAEGICSMVLDLEDAVDESRATAALANTAATLDALASAPDPLPAMVFVRIRTQNCIERLTTQLGAGAAALRGFVIPKFEAATGEHFLTQTATAAAALGRRLYCMPVLETRQIGYRETRSDELHGIADILDQYSQSGSVPPICAERSGSVAIATTLFTTFTWWQLRSPTSSTTSPAPTAPASW